MQASQTFFFVVVVKQCPTVINELTSKAYFGGSLARLKFRRASSEVRNNCDRFQADCLLVKTVGHLFDVG